MAHWKHGWIPLTPTAIRQKNHGFKPGPKSKLGRMKPGSAKPAVGAKPSKAPRDLMPGDVIHHHGVPVTVLSHPREGAVRGYKAAWGRRHDTGARGRVDFLSNDPMDIHGREKVPAADVKAHQTALKTGLDAKRARLEAIRSNPLSAHNDATDATGKPTRYANEAAASAGPAKKPTTAAVRARAAKKKTSGRTAGK